MLSIIVIVVVVVVDDDNDADDDVIIVVRVFLLSMIAVRCGAVQCGAMLLVFGFYPMPTCVHDMCTVVGKIGESSTNCVS